MTKFNSYMNHYNIKNIFSGVEIFILKIPDICEIAYLYVNPWTGKMASLYWDGSLHLKDQVILVCH